MCERSRSYSPPAWVAGLGVYPGIPTTVMVCAVLSGRQGRKPENRRHDMFHAVSEPSDPHAPPGPRTLFLPWPADRGIRAPDCRTLSAVGYKAHDSRRAAKNRQSSASGTRIRLSRSASRPGIRFARSGPKSLAVPTVEARIVRSARVDARRGRAPGRDPKGGAVHDPGEKCGLGGVRRAGTGAFRRCGRGHATGPPGLREEARRPRYRDARPGCCSAPDIK